MADPSAVYTLLPRVAECWGGGFPFIPVITFILPHTFCVRVCVCLSLSLPSTPIFMFFAIVSVKRVFV